VIRGKYRLALIASLAFVFSSAYPLSAGATRGPISASAHVSPHSIRVGERATVEIAIVTPPDHRILPLAPPRDLRNLEVELAETLPIEKQEDRWNHVIRVRFRPREIGSLAWPTTVLEIETPNGATEKRVLESLPFEVKSVLHSYGGRSEPFPARPAPPPRRKGFAVQRVALGAFIAASLLALFFVLKRRGARLPPPVAPAAEGKPWAVALNDLGNAAETADPGAAAAATAAALRRYMERRFGALTRAQTTEELAGATPPFGATSRWPTFTALLLELDTLRFSPRRSPEQAPVESECVGELLDRSREFVEASMPPEALR